MKKFVIVALALSLAACGAIAPRGATKEEAEDSMTLVQASLPEGCTLHFAGKVEVEGSSYPSRIFVTTCGDVTTVSETHTVPQGKTSRPQTDVTIIQ